VRAAATVELLVEMCADDHAARHHGSTALTAALRRFHQLGAGPAPTGAIAAADSPTALRIARLRGAPPPVPHSVQWAVTLGALAVATTPASLYLLPL